MGLLRIVVVSSRAAKAYDEREATAKNRAKSRSKFTVGAETSGGAAKKSHMSTI